MATRRKPTSKPAQERKVARVMREFKEGDLKRPDGETVTDRKQAVAIALSEAGLSWRDRARNAGRKAVGAVGRAGRAVGKGVAHAAGYVRSKLGRGKAANPSQAPAGRNAATGKTSPASAGATKSAAAVKPAREKAAGTKSSAASSAAAKSSAGKSSAANSSAATSAAGNGHDRPASPRAPAANRSKSRSVDNKAIASDATAVAPAEASRSDLLRRAERRGIAGRARMSKEELQRALSH